MAPDIATLVAVVQVAAKIAARLVRGGDRKAWQQALERALLVAVLELEREHAGLGNISFHDALRSDAVVAEMCKVFDPGETPSAESFRRALEEAGYDLQTLPCSAEAIFARLLECIKSEARQDVNLQGLLTAATTERTLAKVERAATRSDLAEVRREIDGLHGALMGGSGDAGYVLVDLHADYGADIQHARELLKGSRFAEAKVALEQQVARPTFKRTNGETQAEVLRLHGVACMRLHDLTTAERSFSRALQFDPENAKLRMNEAELDFRGGRTEKAAESARSLLSEHPGSPDALRVLALAALEKQDIDQALQRLDECEDRDTPASLSIRAACEMERGDYDAAVDHVEEALGAEPDDPMLLLQKASMQMERVFASPGLQSGLAVIGDGAHRRQLEDARDTLRTAVESWDEHGLKDYSAALRGQLAYALALLDEEEEGLAVVVEATQCCNADPRAWLLRAQYEIKLRDRSGAAESLCKARAMAPDDAAVVTLEAELIAEKDPLEAAAEIDKSYSEQWEVREKLEARVMQSRFLWLGGKREDALALLDALPPELRETPRITAARSAYLLRLGKAQDAQDVIEDAVQVYPEEPAIMHLAGEAHLAAGDYRQALRRYARALRLAPNSDSLSGIALACLQLQRPHAALKLLAAFSAKGVPTEELAELKARAHFNLGELQEAGEAYEDQLRTHPDDLAALTNASVCWWRLGRRDRMAPLLERITQVDPTNWTACAQLAQLCLADEKKDEAFCWAREARARAKDDPKALLHYFWIAFHTGHEDEAFPVLQEIADRFPEFSGLVRVPEAEGIEMYRELLKRGERIESAYEERKLPITFVADRLNRSLPLDRAIRQRAQLPFWADSGSREDTTAAAVACKSACEVVIDYSALATLAQIGMLRAGARCFPTIHIPSQVREQIQVDRFAVNERLTYLRDRGQRRIWDRLETSGTLDRWREYTTDPGEWPEGISRHDKHLCERADAWYLLDQKLAEARSPEELPGTIITSKALLECLWENGLVTAEHHDTAAEYLRKTGNWDSDDTRPPEKLPDRLVIDLFALGTWECMELLQLVLDTVPTVLVSPWTRYHLSQDVGEEEVHEEAIGLIRAIEDALGQEGSTFVVSQATSGGPDEQDGWKGAISLACEKQIPLWTDDLITRVIHAGETPGAAHFSTRSVVELAREKGSLPLDEYHRAILTLVQTGFEYCSFNAVTLVWAIARHNYQPNPHADLLLRKRGTSVDFWNVAALAIAAMAESHEKDGRPTALQLTSWMRRLTGKIGEATLGVSRQYVRLVAKRLEGRSSRVRLLWENLVAIWDSIGWYIRNVGL